MYTHSRDLFKVSGKPLELQATAASTDNKVGCSRRGNTPLDGNNAWRLGDPLPSSPSGRRYTDCKERGDHGSWELNIQSVPRETGAGSEEGPRGNAGLES